MRHIKLPNIAIYSHTWPFLLKIWLLGNEIWLFGLEFDLFWLKIELVLTWHLTYLPWRLTYLAWNLAFSILDLTTLAILIRIRLFGIWIWHVWLKMWLFYLEFDFCGLKFHFLFLFQNVFHAKIDEYFGSKFGYLTQKLTIWLRNWLFSLKIWKVLWLKSLPILAKKQEFWTKHFLSKQKIQSLRKEILAYAKGQITSEYFFPKISR